MSWLNLGSDSKSILVTLAEPVLNFQNKLVIQLSLTPHPNTRSAYFESFVSDQHFLVLLVNKN